VRQEIRLFCKPDLRAETPVGDESEWPIMLTEMVVARIFGVKSCEEEVAPWFRAFVPWTAIQFAGRVELRGAVVRRWIVDDIFNAVPDGLDPVF